jgi:hypothetical protein
MPTKTTAEIRQRALELYFAQNPDATSNPEDNELREDGFWHQARYEAENREALRHNEPENVSAEQEAAEIAALRAKQQGINEQIDVVEALPSIESVDLTEKEEPTEPLTSKEPSEQVNPLINEQEKEKAQKPKPTHKEVSFNLPKEEPQRERKKMSEPKKITHRRTPISTTPTPKAIGLWCFNAIQAEISGGRSSLLLAFAGSIHLNDFLHQAGLITDDAWNAVKGMSTLFSESANITAIAGSIGSVLKTVVEGTSDIVTSAGAQKAQTTRAKIAAETVYSWLLQALFTLTTFSTKQD